jgi:hypothetical protein
MPLRTLLEYCAAARGATILGTAVLLIATGLMRTFASSISVFELYIPQRGPLSPFTLLLFCPLALFYFAFLGVSLVPLAQRAIDPDRKTANLDRLRLILLILNIIDNYW